MTSSWVIAFLLNSLVFVFSSTSQTHSDFDFQRTSQSTAGKKSLVKRSVLTFPPDSVFQINMGVTLAGQLERNTGVIVLALQQNGPLPSKSLPLLSPSLVVAARKFSIYDHLRDVITSYGLNGSECLRKMVCQIGETPLLGGLLEDVITFALSPSKHRSVQSMPQGKKRNYLDSLLEAERLGKQGGNCSFAYQKCTKTPLDFISALVHL